MLSVLLCARARVGARPEASTRTSGPRRVRRRQGRGCLGSLPHRQTPYQPKLVQSKHVQSEYERSRASPQQRRELGQDASTQETSQQGGIIRSVSAGHRAVSRHGTHAGSDCACCKMAHPGRDTRSKLARPPVAAHPMSGPDIA
eukprot:3519857-Rhodomonas_salina.1